MEKPKKILILTSSGGGGLLQAATAKEQQERLKDPQAIIIKRDMLKDWFWKRIGMFGVRKWDQAQRQGDVSTIEWLLNKQLLGDFFFWPRIFYCALRLFFQEDVDRVIDTQPLGTSAILKALRLYNKRRGKKVILEKVVVDLPTEKATHFFRPIRSLAKRDRPFLRLNTIEPLLKEGQTSEEFWQTNCRLSESAIQYEHFVVRQAFCRFQDKPRENTSCSLKAQLFQEEEKRFVAKVLEKRPLKYKIQSDWLEMLIEPSDKVGTILLGSQPAYGATLEYVRKFIRLAQEDGAVQVPIHLFVLCAEHRAGEHSLFRRVSDLLLRTKDFPKQLTVIPLTFQSEEMIAPLFHRSDWTCTRSGGQTVMELMCVREKGDIWIHSEAKLAPGEKSLSLDNLLKGIPGWEAANAVYLQQKLGAMIVTPDTFMSHARRLLSSTAESS